MNGVFKSLKNTPLNMMAADHSITTAVLTPLRAFNNCVLGANVQLFYLILLAYL